MIPEGREPAEGLGEVEPGLPPTAGPQLLPEYSKHCVEAATPLGQASPSLS